ncbi:retrotransposon protein, putative, ty1-copia subclass [Tanacetum coccineum]
MVRSMMNLTTLLLSFWDYALETATRILNMVPNKKVDKTPYELCGRAEELEEIQDKDTSPFENTSEIPMEVEGFEPPQEEVVPVRRSARIHRAPDCLCLNVEVKEYSLRDLNEPPNYKAAILDPESDKWVDAMNMEMQSMKDNQVWCLVDLPPNSIRILMAIATFYDYEIWQMDVKTVFLNGYLNKDIYMVQPEGFIDPSHPRKYLRNTKDMLLVYGGNPKAELRVDCYCDARFKTDRDDIKSQTGYVFILNGGAMDWKSSKQSTTAMSATEAEYIVASEATMEVAWIRKFISGFDENLADPFTKALSEGKLTQHARSIGLRLASSFMMCPPNSHDIHKMNIELPQLTRLSLYGSASLSESYVSIMAPQKKALAATILNGALYLLLLFYSSLTLNIHMLYDAFFHFADGEYLTGALDSIVDLRTCRVSKPPSLDNAPSSESSSSDLLLSSKLLLFLDPSLVSELPPAIF